MSLFNAPFFCLCCGADFIGEPKGGGRIGPRRGDLPTLARVAAPAYCADCISGNKVKLPETAEEKAEWYKAGRYSFPPPPVCTAFWGEADWIRFIDSSGRWTPLPSQLQKGGK